MRAALEELPQLGDDLDETPLILCTDSQAALATLASGAGAQKTALGASIWRLLPAASKEGRQIRLHRYQPTAGSQEMNVRTSWRKRSPVSHRMAPADV